MHIKRGVLLEKNHGLEMGKEMHWNISCLCRGGVIQKIGRWSVDFLLLYLVYEVPWKYHFSSLDRQKPYLLVKCPYQGDFLVNGIKTGLEDSLEMVLLKKDSVILILGKRECRLNDAFIKRLTTTRETPVWVWKGASFIAYLMTKTIIYKNWS